MENITDLTIKDFDTFLSHFKSISLLTQLKALNVDVVTSSVLRSDVYCNLSGLTKLTEFHNNYPFLSLTVDKCTELVKLSLPQLFDFRVEGTQKALSGLTLLRDVDISYVESCLPSTILQNWRELRRLKICVESLGLHFFPTIATLPHLTDLEISERDYGSDKFYIHIPKIKPLPNLRRLVFAYLRVDPLVFITESNFPKLQAFGCYGYMEFPDHVKKELRRRLPCLRRIIQWIDEV